MAKDWYSPREIWFTRETVLWLLQNLGSLRTGYWPHEASNYIEISIGKKTGGHTAPFVTPVEYAAEIEQRLEKCGIDGLILLAIECWGESAASLGKYFRMPELSILKRRKQALGYVASGPARRWLDTKKRKGESYWEFKKRRKERRSIKYLLKGGRENE